MIPQLADGAVLRAGDQRRNAPVAAAVQLRHRPAGLLLVGDGHRGVGVRRQGAVLVVIRATDIGDVQRRQLLGGIVGPAAQQDQAPQPLFPLHHGAPLHLVVAGADLLHHQGIAPGRDLLLDDPDDIRVKRVGHAPHHQADGVGLGFHQVPGGVVGNVIGSLNGGEHLAPVFRADVRPVVEHPRHRADAYAALPRNILDGHKARFVSLLLPFQRGGNITGNVSDPLWPYFTNFRPVCQWQL